MVELTREEHNFIAEGRGIEKRQNMSTKTVINTLNRYDSRCKVKTLSQIGLEKWLKYQIFQKMK